MVRLERFELPTLWFEAIGCRYLLLHLTDPADGLCEMWRSSSRAACWRWKTAT